MKYQYLVFDLDGTISDPKEGICRSTNYALSQHGLPEYDDAQISRFIGPPLDEMFRQLADTQDENLITQLIFSFRERYNHTGYAENTLYPDMAEILHQLHQHPEIKLGLCTSKRTDFAEKILQLFKIEDYFSFISGGDIGIAKWQQLDNLLSEGTLSPQAVMIGDRDIDLQAARKNNLHAAGVMWGYGSQQELQDCKPDYLFSSSAELLNLLP